MAFSYTVSNPSTIFSGHGAKYSVMDFNCARETAGGWGMGRRGNLERAFRHLHMHCHEFLN